MMILIKIKKIEIKHQKIIFKESQFFFTVDIYLSDPFPEMEKKQEIQRRKTHVLFQKKLI